MAAVEQCYCRGFGFTTKNYFDLLQTRKTFSSVDANTKVAEHFLTYSITLPLTSKDLILDQVTQKTIKTNVSTLFCHLG